MVTVVLSQNSVESASEVRIFKICLIKISSRNHCTAEICTLQIDRVKNSPCKIGINKRNTAHIGPRRDRQTSQSQPREVSIGQINTFSNKCLNARFCARPSLINERPGSNNPGIGPVSPFSIDLTESNPRNKGGNQRGTCRNQKTGSLHPLKPSSVLEALFGFSTRAILGRSHAFTQTRILADFNHA